MTNYRYKCVPVPEVVSTGIRGKNLHSDAVTTYESIINEAAQGGWKLVQIDTVESLQQAGCLFSLFGGKAETIRFKMLVFQREK